MHLEGETRSGGPEPVDLTDFGQQTKGLSTQSLGPMAPRQFIRPVVVIIDGFEAGARR